MCDSMWPLNHYGVAVKAKCDFTGDNILLQLEW